MFANEDRIAACRRGEDGSYLIDRSPKYFEPILNYLRTGQVLIKSHNTVVPGFRVLGFSALPGFRARPATAGGLLRSCSFITVMRARLKVPAKDSPALLFLSRGKEEERKTTTISCFSPAE